MATASKRKVPIIVAAVAALLVVVLGVAMASGRMNDASGGGASADGQSGVLESEGAADSGETAFEAGGSPRPRSEDGSIYVLTSMRVGESETFYQYDEFGNVLLMSYISGYEPDEFMYSDYSNEYGRDDHGFKTWEAQTLTERLPTTYYENEYTGDGKLASSMEYPDNDIVRPSLFEYTYHDNGALKDYEVSTYESQAESPDERVLRGYSKSTYDEAGYLVSCEKQEYIGTGNDQKSSYVIEWKFDEKGDPVAYHVIGTRGDSLDPSSGERTPEQVDRVVDVTCDEAGNIAAVEYLGLRFEYSYAKIDDPSPAARALNVKVIDNDQYNAMPFL